MKNAMESVWSTALLSVSIVSLISLVGAVIISRQDQNHAVLRFLIALAIGALLGDVVIHLLPEAYEGLGLGAALWLLGGFVVFLLIEKVLHWRHEHISQSAERIEPYGVMNLIGDGLHNFIDGALIGASYLVSFPIGLATTIAVVLHEVPQELGDYAILRSAGFSRAKALGWNFVSALFAVVGAVVVLFAEIDIEVSAQKILAFTAGGFIYIVVLLVQKLEDEAPLRRTFGQALGVVLGVALMWLITFIE
jgi:zinc and cadmium transporter